MNKRDKDKIYNLYENTIFIAKAEDLSPGYNSDNSDHTDHSIKEPDTDSQEIHMAKSDLMKIASNVQSLTNILDNEPGLEGWVAAKITLAANYIASVTDWLEYKSSTKECGCNHD